MSTLSVTNISDGTNSTATTNVVKGSAKAWVNFNGTGTPAIREAYNVSSITDTATGRYYVNFTTAFADNEYCVVTNPTRTYDSANNNNAGTNTCDIETGRFELIGQYLDSTLADWQGLHCVVYR